MILALGTVSVTLPGAQYPFNYSIDRQQELGVTEDGTVKVYDHQVNTYWIKANVKVNDSQRSSLQSFLKDIVAFANATFSLTPDAGVNLGSGVGSTVIVRYWDKSFSETCYALSQYEISLVFRREAT